MPTTSPHWRLSLCGLVVIPALDYVQPVSRKDVVKFLSITVIDLTPYSEEERTKMRVARFPLSQWLLALLIWFPFAYCMTEKSTIGSSIDSAVNDVGEFPEARRSPRYLCVQAGCTCDTTSGNAEENMMANCDCRNTNTGRIDSTNPVIT